MAVSRIIDGFGDFYFFPNTFVCHHCDLDARLALLRVPKRTVRRCETDEETNPTAVAAAESLTVDFLKLPTDVRKIIFGYWTEPFRNRSSFIKVSLANAYDPQCHPYRNSYSIRIPSLLSDNELVFFSSLWEHGHINPDAYHSIWSLSKVNRQIRKELGEAFWNKVSMDLNQWKYLFINFLHDRPAAAQGIKKMKTEWECYDEATGLDYTIIDFCNYLSVLVDLDVLKFVFCTTVKIAREIISKVDEEGGFPDAGAHSDDDSSDEDDEDTSADTDEEDEGAYSEPSEDDHARLERIEAELNPLVSEILRPTPPGRELTEQELYLAQGG
ncbi:hypothetical protein B0J14DRAFT_666063 [Halenospora varia]|nr:hypothetical protein B0J14DRAFT_666063 [Halenospora varia]